MLKKVFTILIFMFLVNSAYSLTFLEYLAHCNVSMGPNMMLGGKVSGDNNEYIVFVHTNIGTFNFEYKPSDIDTPVAGIAFGLRFPFYFNKEYALGLNFEFGGIDVMSMLGGLYFDYYFSPRWSFVGSVGMSMGNISYNLGKIMDKDLDISGWGTAGLGIGAGAKFHILKYMYLEAGYRLGWKTKINEYSLNYDGEKVADLYPPPPDLIMGMTHNFSIKLGAGI